MKELTFNKDSWHFWVATKIARYQAPYAYSDGYVGGDKADICTYSRHVVIGMLFLALSAVGIAIIGFVFWNILFGIIFSLIYGTWLFNFIAEAAMSVIGLATLAGILSYAVVWIQGVLRDRSYSRRYNPPPDGFIKHAYNSWKEKYCIQINFKE